jgi:ABC-type amino acid transport substrate-binding protein
MKKRIGQFTLAAAVMVLLASCSSKQTKSGSTVSAGEGTQQPVAAAAADSSASDGIPLKADGTKLMAGVAVKVASDTFKPYRFQDSSGKWTGYDFAVLDALSDVLGFTYEFNEIEFSGVVASVSMGKSTLAPTLCATEERKKVLDFTEPYHIPKPLFAVQGSSGYTSVAGLAGKKVAVTFGTTWETMLRDNFTGGTITAMDTLSSAVADVKTGRQDALFGDSVQIAQYAKENGLKTISWNVDYQVPADNFGFKKGSPYVEPFNKALEYLKKTGKLAEIQTLWLGKDSVTDWSSVAE